MQAAGFFSPKKCRSKKKLDCRIEILQIKEEQLADDMQRDIYSCTHFLETLDMCIKQKNLPFVQQHQKLRLHFVQKV